MQKTLPMISTVKSTDISTINAQIICLRLPCSQILTMEKFPFVFEFPHVVETINAKDGYKPGTIFLFGNGKTETYVLVLFCQRFEGKPCEGDLLSQRQMWLACCVRNLSGTKGIKSLVFADTHLKNELSQIYKTMLKVWSFENPSIKIYFTDDDENILDLIDDASKFNLFEELYHHHDFHSQIRDFLKSRICVCKCGDKFVRDKQSVLVCKKCQKTPTNVHALTWENSTLEVMTFNIPYEWGWASFFSECLENNTIRKISKELSLRKGKYSPSLCNVYKAFEMIQPQNIKVVIFGQDPYPGENVACGLAFSANLSGKAIPKSLVNIFKELEDDGFKASDSANLEKWVKQGVFLINSALTLEGGVSGSHEKLWSEFTKALVKYLDRLPLPLVVIMWGAKAQVFDQYFSVKHKKIKSTHPSPFSAANGFFGSKPFSRANLYLQQLGQQGIDWNLS